MINLLHTPLLVVVLHKSGKETVSGEYQKVYERFNNALYSTARTDSELLKLVQRKAVLWGRLGA
jgi:hypothetical protein